MSLLRILGGSAALFALAACSGGGGSSTVPATPTSDPIPTAAPIASASTMNPLTSYTVYVGTTDGSSISTELSSISSGTAAADGSYVGAPPADFVSGSGQAPTRVPGAIVAFPDGSTVVADALGNFDASQSAWAAANQSLIATGQQVEVIVDATNVAASASPLDTFVDADEPVGGTVAASAARSTLETRPPAPPVLASLAISPATNGMYDKEQRSYFAFGFDASAKKVSLGKQKIVWSLANCSGAAPAGSLVAMNEASTIVYRAPAQGSAGTCPDIITAAYTNPATSTAKVGTTVKATAKAFYNARETAVLYSGTVVDPAGKPVAKGLVDFFATATSATAGRVVAVTDKNGNFSQKIAAGRTPSFLVASRVPSGKGFKYQFYNVSVSGAANATTGLILKETTPTTRPAGI